MAGDGFGVYDSTVTDAWTRQTFANSAEVFVEEEQRNATEVSHVDGQVADAVFEPGTTLTQ